MSTPLSSQQFVGEVRNYLRDFTELNRLISGEESSDRMIEYCTILALDEWNTTPPVSSNTVANFPSRVILLQLTLINLLTSVGILKSRNKLVYNDSGFQVQTETQDDSYMRWVTLFRQQVDPKIHRLKVSLNIAGAFDGGGIGSEYGQLHGWYGFSTP